MLRLYMGRRYKQILAVLFLVIVSSTGLIACRNSTFEYTFITESDAREIMDNVEAATNNKDMDSVIKYMAPSVEINMTMETPKGKQKKQFSREQFKANAENTLSMVSGYKYKRENDRISISDDGQSANFEADIIEELETQGKKIKAITREKVVMEIIDGKILVTKMDGETKMLPR